jgi:peptide/nickel transport system ATP-binding protein
VQPELLIADEPTSMLDAALRATILKLLLDLRGRLRIGTSFITHDIGRANYMSDRILAMYRGDVVEQGLAEQGAVDRQHLYTAHMMADVPKIKSRTQISVEPTDARAGAPTLEDFVSDRTTTPQSVRRS